MLIGLAVIIILKFHNCSTCIHNESCTHIVLSFIIHISYNNPIESDVKLVIKYSYFSCDGELYTELLFITVEQLLLVTTAVVPNENIFLTRGCKHWDHEYLLNASKSWFSVPVHVLWLLCKFVHDPCKCVVLCLSVYLCQKSFQKGFQTIWAVE